jgi:uncharacterized membrane protein
MILFSDAVLAIAITLLAIEIKIPVLEPGEITERALLGEIRHLVPKLLGFLISFFIIGVYWTRHHTLFGYVTASTGRLIWLNLLFLFSIALMPFSTGLLGEYSTPDTLHLVTPLIVYALNVCLTGVMNLLLWRYVTDPRNHVTDGTMDPAMARAARLRAVIIPAIFALIVPVAFIDAVAARYVPLLIPITVRLLSRWDRRG